MGCHRQYVQGGYVHGTYDSRIIRKLEKMWLKEEEERRDRVSSFIPFLEESWGGERVEDMAPTLGFRQKGRIPVSGSRHALV
jgi:hypothetical protein